MGIKLCVGCVVAGTAGVAAAQGQNVVASDFSLSITYSDDGLSLGDTVTGTIVASWTGAATTFLSSINIDLIANANLVSVEAAPILGWANPVLGWDADASFADGASMRGIEGAQSSLFAPPQTGNPFVVGTFRLRTIQGGVLRYTAILADDAPFAFSVSDTALPLANPAQFGVSSMGTNSLMIFPSAPSLGVFAAAGLVVSRRRRGS